MAMAKPKAVERAIRPAGASGKDALRQEHPTLWGYLTEVEWDDGSPRKTATLTVFCEEGVVKLCLNDRDGGKTAWVTGWSLEDAIDCLELRLLDETCEWRSSTYAAKGKRR